LRTRLVNQDGFFVFNSDSTHRFFDECAYLFLFRVRQLLERKRSCPHRAIVEVRVLVKAKGRVSHLELGRRRKKADNLALFVGICSRLAIVWSDPFNSAIFASTALSPAALSLFARASAFNSWARAFIASRSSSVHTVDDLLVAVLLTDLLLLFFAA
jgi:hypothetical protein